MDPHFLEFWGNLLIQAAKGQQQMEELNRLTNQGAKGFEAQNALFRKFYGLGDANEKRPVDTEEWEKAVRDFQTSLKQYLNLMGVVPKTRHLELVEKYENLKKKAADQEETIEHLRMLLNDKGMAQGDAAEGFQNLIKKQTDQFQDLLKGFGAFLESDS
ncbi:MAG: hypothetical protein LJE96_02970 [Deltaproteobacteria bacterium]|nr:hypothetical protein [Deltaproteobacteria bacterium]